MRSIYDNVTLAGVAGPIFATTGGNTAVNGTSVDTKGFNTAVLRAYSTPVTGVPGTITASLTAVLQESADNTNWANALDNTGVAIQVAQSATTPAVVGSARIEGLGLQRLRYLRVVLTGKTVAASGTSNNQFTAFAVIELSRAYQNPTNTTTSNT